MYDPRREFLSPHGGTVQFDPDDLCPFPISEAADAWDPENLFVPHPRAPVDDPGLSRAGAAAARCPGTVGAHTCSPPPGRRSSARCSEYSLP